MPILRRRWEGHEHRRLVEPFCGGLALTLALMPRRALLNDINPHVIGFYGWLQRGLSFDLAFENTAESFYAARARFNALVADSKGGSREAAALFYYLNRTCYNGLCRFNRKGEFNVPFGRYRRLRYRTDFSPFREAFAGWTFRAGDFESLPLRRGDFVYADPPYDVPFTAYAKEGFAWRDQVRTAEWLARHAGPVVLVNQATDRIRDLYEGLGFQLEEIEAPRRISCTGDRTGAREVVATRNL